MKNVTQTGCKREADEESKYYTTYDTTRYPVATKNFAEEKKQILTTGSFFTDSSLSS